MKVSPNVRYDNYVFDSQHCAFQPTGLVTFDNIEESWLDVSLNDEPGPREVHQVICQVATELLTIYNAY